MTSFQLIKAERAKPNVIRLCDLQGQSHSGAGRFTSDEGGGSSVSFVSHAVSIGYVFTDLRTVCVVGLCRRTSETSSLIEALALFSNFVKHPAMVC